MITNVFRTYPPGVPQRLPGTEAARLARWLAHAQSGASLTALVTGTLGSGKSRFLEAARDEAEAQSFQLGELRFPPRLFRHAPGDLDHAPQLLASGADAIADFMRRARLSSERWLITLDDAHLQDPEDIAILARAITGSSTSGSLFLVAATTTERGGDPRVARLIAQLAVAVESTTHELERWSGTDVDELILKHLPTFPPSIRFGFEVARLTEGNPALISAYARMVAALPVEERLTAASGARRLVDLAPPAMVQHHVHARVDMVTGVTRQVLDTLAVWSLPASPATLSHLSRLHLNVVEQCLDELEAQGHVAATTTAGETQFEVRERVTALVLAGSAPSLLTQSVHEHASKLLVGASVPPSHEATRARHHMAAGAPGVEAAQEVVGAAELLIRRGRWASARDLIEPLVLHAIKVDLPVAVLVSAVHVLAETYTRSGDATTAERLVMATRYRHHAVEPGYLSSLLALALGWASSGRELEATTTLRYVAAHPEATRGTRSRAISSLVRLSHWNGQPKHAIDLARHGRRLHRGEPDAIAELWVQQAQVSRMQGRSADSLLEARRALRTSRRSTDPTASFKAMVAIGEARLDSESADRGAQWMRRALKGAERAQMFVEVAWVRNRLIPAYIESGVWSNAELAGRRGVSLAASMNLRQSLRRSEAALALVQGLRGEVSAEYLQTRIVAEDLGNPLIFTAIAVALYEQQRAAGLRDRARHGLMLTAEMLADRPGWERLEEIEVLPRLIETCAIDGDLEGLVLAVDRLGSLVEAAPSRLPIAEIELMVAQGRLALLEGRPDAAASLLALARSGYAAMAYRWRWAQAAAPLGQAQAEAGDRGSAIETLRTGIRSLDQLGAAGRAREMRAQLQELGGRAPRTQPSQALLTPRQRQVAILASRGLSDKEIARELGITWRTVTTHMYTILGRLSLRSRYELANWIVGEHAES